MNHRAKPGPVKRSLTRYPQLIAYIGLGLVMVFAFWLDGQNRQADEEARCQAGVDTRNVDRDQTQRIYDLALTFVPKNVATLPPNEKKKVTAYVAKVSDFRSQSFETIKPSKLCAPYVDDDNVTPSEWVKAHPPVIPGN